MSDYIKKEQDLLAIVSKHAKDWKSLENVPAKALLRIMRDAIAYSEAAKATGTAGELPPLPEEIEVGGEGWGWEDFQSWKTFSVEHMLHYGAACAQAAFAEAARHDKDGNHADDLRGMLEELQTEFDKQQSAFWACSEKLAQVQRNQETDLSDIRILELAEEDFGEQDDRNVKNEALLSFARKVQAARQPAPVVKPFGWAQFIDGEQTQNFARDEKELATVKAITSTMSGLKNVEYVPVFAALAATAAPVLSDEQRKKLEYIANWMDSSVRIIQNAPDDYGPASQFDYDMGEAAHEILTILAATKGHP